MSDFKNPARFTVGGQEIKVKTVEKLKGGILGECCVGEGRIDLALTSDDGDLFVSSSSMQNTFFHELVHCILDTMGEKELSANEKFVCSFSGFLTEVIRSMELATVRKDEVVIDRKHSPDFLDGAN